MSPATSKLPDYLKAYISTQNYSAYSARDHAAWRYIMRQNTAFFSRHAVPVYLEGLKKTGIHLERIPRVEEMDDCLAKLGWGAVPVQGFIPPAAFLDFQARAVLPIACDMRTVDHLAYTPAPDIVHEAAGHAPILAYAPYSEYLHRYAAMAQKAIASLDDIRLYEAIRRLSDIKENPDRAPGSVEQAEQALREVAYSIQKVSESAKVARMNWWTVEYGLVGTPEKHRIYGAGLLSSVGESQACLSNKVRKIALSLECVETSYDITEPQPQLFVARDMGHLVEVLEAFEATLSYRTGGVAGLAQALEAGTVTTSVLDSGLAISGVLERFECAGDEPCFLKYTGPVQLSHSQAQLPGHGRERHPTGFSSPLGRWKGAPPKPVSTLTDNDLASLGLQRGKAATLEFKSGFEVKGTLLGWHRSNGALQLLTWGDCRVTRGAECFFEPAWGQFDMAVGEAVPCVHGGPADRGNYGELNVGRASTAPGRTSPYTGHELKLFEAYAKVRELRRLPPGSAGSQLEPLVQAATTLYPDEWLLHLELFELAQGEKASLTQAIQDNLLRMEKHQAGGIPELIRKGIQLAP